MKKFLNKILGIVALFLFVVMPAFSAELNVYPVPAVFINKNLDNSAFQKVFTQNRQNFTNEYLSQFNKYFSLSNDEISDKTKYKTFAVYIHIPRASEYYVKKSESLLDIYLPLTMSINFVNMASGETLYSYPLTSYFKYETAFEKDEEAQKNTITNLCEQNFKQTVEKLIKQASVDFKPFNITTKIIDTYRSFYILDKGIETGIAKGDLLSDEKMNQLSVVYSNVDYSVAKKVLGKPNSGGSFSKFSNNSITQLKKPKVLFINDFGNEKLYSLFSAALGSEAEFSLITTNKTFYDMQTALVSLNMDFKSNNAYNRTLPDYFLKLYFTPPVYTQFKSNKAYYNVDKYAMLACGIIFDKAGRIAYSKCVDDEMINKVTGTVRFSDEANYEIVTKNILTKLAESIQKEVQFKNSQFRITKVEGQYITLSDLDGFLRPGNVLTVFKKIKTEKSGREILVPAWDYKVITINNGVAECKMSKPYIDNLNQPSKKDIAQMSTITRSANKANMYNFDTQKSEINGSEIHLKYFNRIALGTLASSLNAPVAMPISDFYEQISELNSFGFKERIEIPENSDKLTIKVVYKINETSSEIKGNIVKKQYEVIVGIVSKNNGKTVKQDGLKQTVTIVVPKDGGEEIIEYELMKFTYPLIKQIAAKF